MRKLTKSAITDISFDFNKVKSISDDQFDLFETTIWTNKQDSINLYQRIAQEKKLATFDVSEAMNNKGISSYINAKTELSTEYNNIMDNDNSPSIQMRYYNRERNEIDIGSLDGQTSTIGLPLPENFPAKDEFMYYFKKGINIYNKNDPAFNIECYYNRELDYDLTQKYRYNELYTGKAFTLGATCISTDFDLTNNRLVFVCPIETAVSQPIQVKQKDDLKEANDKVDNLPTMCHKEINRIQNNFGFWTCLLVTIIGLPAFFIFLTSTWLTSKQESIDQWLINDEMPTDYARANKETAPEQQIKTEDIQIVVHNQSFISILLYNMGYFHPVATLFHQSIICPLFFKISVFLFMVFNFFGFNALFYNENMIFDKIADKNRDNFGYPMKSEFEKIVYTLLISMGLVMIVRLIVLITMNDRDQLFNSVSGGVSGEEKIAMCKAFWKKGLIRRIIAYVFMLTWSLFFFYYTVVFCGIYVKTQYTWFYSGLWTLFMSWVLFAPFSLLMISIVEKCSPSCGYYAKQIFWF